MKAPNIFGPTAQAWLPSALVETLAAHQQLVAWTAVAGVVLAIGGGLLVPWLVVRVPADYLLHEPARPRNLSFWRLLVWLGRHLLAVVLLLAGIAMLVLPGQGLLTILVSLALMDLPRKRSALRYLLRRTGLITPINRLRARRGRSPLRTDAPP